MIMTTTQNAPEDPDVAHGRRGMRRAAWAFALAAVLLTIVSAAALLRAGTSDQRASAYEIAYKRGNQVLEVACPLIGASATADPSLDEACTRNSAGQPPIPPPAAEPAAAQVATGISTIDKIGRCALEVVLTNGTRNRFDDLCGAPGKTGPTGSAGPTGPTGKSGAPGSPGVDGDDGVGIDDIRPVENCSIEITLTDGRTRVIGPLCQPAVIVTQHTENYPDGSVKRCVRSGGSDTAPIYDCTISPPTSSESPPPETTTEITTTTTRPPEGDGPLPLPGT